MELPRPEVTVTDPRQPGQFVPAEEPAAPRLDRRGATVLAALALVGATVLFAVDVVRDRRDAVEQRRLDGVVDVVLGETDARWTSTHDSLTGTGTVQGLVRLVNRGPRDVRVVEASLGRLRGGDSGEPLEADGGEDVLPLRRTVRCPPDGGPPPPEPEAEQLRLLLETPTGAREVVLEGDGLPRGSLDDSVQRACAYPPLGDRVGLSATVVRVEGRSAVLQLDMTNGGRRPVRLLSLVPTRGLVVTSVDGDPSLLPVLLPERTRSFADVRSFELRLSVVCGALIGADPLRPFEEVSAIVEEEDRSQMTSVTTVALDPDRLLRQLAGRTCSSG